MNPGPRSRSPRTYRERPNALTRARLIAGLTQADLARRIGVAQPQASRWERQGWVWEWEVCPIANALHVPPDRLVDSEISAGGFPRVWVRL